MHNNFMIRYSVEDLSPIATISPNAATQYETESNTYHCAFCSRDTKTHPRPMFALDGYMHETEFKGEELLVGNRARKTRIYVCPIHRDELKYTVTWIRFTLSFCREGFSLPLFYTTKITEIPYKEHSSPGLNFFPWTHRGALL